MDTTPHARPDAVSRGPAYRRRLLRLLATATFFNGYDGFVLPFAAISLSIAMNHCGVLRKITGFLERQECGY